MLHTQFASVGYFIARQGNFTITANAGFIWFPPVCRAASCVWYVRSTSSCVVLVRGENETYRLETYQYLNSPKHLEQHRRSLPLQDCTHVPVPKYMVPVQRAILVVWGRCMGELGQGHPGQLGLGVH